MPSLHGSSLGHLSLVFAFLKGRRHLHGRYWPSLRECASLRHVGAERCCHLSILKPASVAPPRPREGDLLGNATMKTGIAIFQYQSGPSLKSQGGEGELRASCEKEQGGGEALQMAEKFRGRLPAPLQTHRVQCLFTATEQLLRH